MPYILSFVFELAKVSNDLNYLNQFDNLIKYRDSIKIFIKSEFLFNDNLYILYAIICVKINNHYTAYCNICLTNELHLNYNFSYYYDDLVDNGIIQLIDGLNFNEKLEKIIKYYNRKILI